MKKKLKSTLLLLLTALAALFVFAGCSIGEPSLEELRETHNLTAQITYYINHEEAEFTPNTAKEKNLYYKADTLPYEITEKTSPGVKCDNYTFDAWYHVKMQDGKPVTSGTYKDANGKEHFLYELGDKADFTKKIQDGEHWLLAARWTTASKVLVKVAHEDKDVTIPLNKTKVAQVFSTNTEALASLKDKDSVKVGDTLIAKSYSTAETVTEDDLSKILSLPVKDNEYTLVDYYEDEACTKLVQWPIKKQDEDVVIYAKAITGDWNILRRPNDVANMFSGMGSLAGERYYLTRDLDCSAVSITSLSDGFGCELQGNGFKISNLKLNESIMNKSDVASTFGDVEATARIENVTFENLTTKISTRDGVQNAYFVFTSLDAGAVIRNVSIQGQFIIVCPSGSFVNNFDDDKTACLFGGYANDAAYVTASNGEGFVVQGNAKDFVSVQQA